MKLSYNEAFFLCLKQWGDMIREIKKNPNELSVVTLKLSWCIKNGFKGVRSYCFFCEFTHNADESCETCPGRLVDPEFCCGNLAYDYRSKPLLFYEKLLKLKSEWKCPLHILLFLHIKWYWRKARLFLRGLK